MEEKKSNNNAQMVALITAICTGIFGSVQSLRAPDAERVDDEIHENQRRIHDQYSVLALHQNQIAEYIKRLSKRNLKLKKRVIELERSLKRMESGVDDDLPLVLFEEEKDKKVLRVSPLPLVEPNP
mgnify:CR=1 FL=1|tara:strand:+ start:488 stop:865 length:378 start_codon:yes stop_codon:yes gene_type:complete